MLAQLQVKGPSEGATVSAEPEALRVFLSQARARVGAKEGIRDTVINLSGKKEVASPSSTLKN